MFSSIVPSILVYWDTLVVGFDRYLRLYKKSSPLVRHWAEELERHEAGRQAEVASKTPEKLPSDWHNWEKDSEWNM